MAQDLIPKRGKFSLLGLEVVRELNLSELPQLALIPPTGPPEIQAVSARHKLQARLVAEGRSNLEVADIVGCTPQRIYQLKQMKTFQELVSYFQDQIQEGGIEDAQRFQGKLLQAGELALDELNERLGDDQQRKLLPVGELRKITEMAADRTVAPSKSAPQGTSPPQSITLNFGTTVKPKEKIIDNDENP